MGQKINPVSLRLQYTNRHFDSCWYSDFSYKSLVTRDLFLQNYLTNFLKALKLPAGRYSIQHLQKKTKVYTFFCVPQLAREWRARFSSPARNKKSINKKKYFFKANRGIKLSGDRGRPKKHLQLHCFYKTLNQLQIHAFQKKITSFQNVRLWSALIKGSQKTQRTHWTPLFQKISPYFPSPLGGLTATKGFPKTARPFREPLSPLPLCPRKGEGNKGGEGNRGLSLPSTGPKNAWATTAPFLPSFLLGQVTGEKQKLSPVHLPLRGVSGQKAFGETLRKERRGSVLKNGLDPRHLSFLQNLMVYKIIKARCLSRVLDRSKQIALPFDKAPGNNLWSSSFQTGQSRYQNVLESRLSGFYGLDLDMMSFKVKNDWQYASFLADEIVSLLEKRIAFRRLKVQLVKQLSKVPAIRGVRITCCGRVGGKSKKAQRAKIESLKYGQTSLHVFSAPIDFSCKTARTSFGSVGVKVWICYAESEEKGMVGTTFPSHLPL